jgi:hypothetical protein
MTKPQIPIENIEMCSANRRVRDGYRPVSVSKMTSEVLNWATAKAKGLNVDDVMGKKQAQREAWREKPPLRTVEDVEDYLDEHWKNVYLDARGSRVSIPDYAASLSRAAEIIEKMPALSWDEVGHCTYRFDPMHHPIRMYGETKAISAVRCYVASILGNEVDVPETYFPDPEIAIEAAAESNDDSPSP